MEQTDMIRKLVFILIAFFLVLVPVNAESGQLPLSNLTTFNTSPLPVGGAGVASGILLDTILVDQATVNAINEFEVHGNGAYNYATAGNATAFHCTAGAICAGYATYNKAADIMVWTFQSNMSDISAFRIVLAYDNNIFQSGITATGVEFQCTAVLANATNPVGLSTGTSACANQQITGSTGHRTYQISEIASFATLNYTVTYPLPGLFFMNVTKSGSVNTASWVNGSVTKYMVDAPPNTNSYQFTVPYVDGIELEGRLLGTYNHVFINSTNFTGIPNPTGNLTGGSPSGQIYYDYSTANINSAYGVNVSLSDANFTTVLGVPVKYYRIRLYDNIGNEISGSPISFSTQQYNTSRLWQFLALGTYHANVTTCSKLLCLESVIDTATIAISQQQYAYSVTSEASSYSTGDTIHFTVVNPSPSNTYFSVFSEVGGQNPINGQIINPNSTAYINLTVTGDMLFGTWQADLFTNPANPVSGAFSGLVANKVFTIGNCIPGTKVCIRWDINNLIGQTNNLYFTTNQNDSTVNVYKPILGTNHSGLADTFTAHPADSQNPYLMDTVGNWNATITDNGNASNTSYANLTVLASLTQLGCNNKLPNYVCWNNATYFAGDAFVLNYKDTAIAGIQIQTANLVIYDPNGAMKYSTNLCSAVFSCVSAISGSVPGAFATNAIPGKYHAVIVHGGTNSSSFTDGTIIADSYAVVSTQPSPTPPPSQTSGTQIIDTLIFLGTNPIIWTIIVTLLAMGLVGQLTKPNASLPVVVTAFASFSIAAFFGAFPIWIPVGMILVAIALIAANIAKVFDVGANK